MDMNIKTEELEKAESLTPGAIAETPSVDESGAEAASTPKAPVTRERAQVGFPWYDLDTAVGVARVILDKGGLPLSREQLAGAMNIAPSGGNFSLKTSTAKMFGLIDGSQGRYQLTRLGFDILSSDEAAAKAARAEAFLNVPLFRRAYDEFRGKTLPPRPHGLEAAFVQFGVPTKSRQVARQVFERSAKQSSFSSVDPDRLIEPVIGANGTLDRQPVERAPEPPAPQAVSSVVASSCPVEDDISLELDELVRGLLRRLPKAGQKWTPEGKAKWLRALSQNLDFVCEVEGDKIVVIEVKQSNEG